MNCPYCSHQGIKREARPLTGKDGVTVASERPDKPQTLRYGCDNGHKFARPVQEKSK